LAEIDKKTQLQTAESQLRQDLLSVHGKQCFDRFKFGDNFSIYYEVGSNRMLSYMIGIGF
jgi:hypothetical protein